MRKKHTNNYREDNEPNAEQVKLANPLIESKESIKLRTLQLNTKEKQNERKYRLEKLVLVSILRIFGLATIVQITSGFLGSKANSIRAGTELVINITFPMVTMITGYFYGRKQKGKG